MINTVPIPIPPLMPDGPKPLAKIGHLKVSPFIKKGFDLVKRIESSKDVNERRRFQFEHLITIAQHEQGVVLQPLCWDDPALKKAMHTARGWGIEQKDIAPKGFYEPAQGLLVYGAAAAARLGSPTLQLVFSHKKDADVKDAKLKSVAPKHIKLDGQPETLFLVENYQHRMDWIKKAAEKYHDLMDSHTDYMEAELRTLSGWYTKTAHLAPAIPKD